MAAIAPTAASAGEDGGPERQDQHGPSTIVWGACSDETLAAFGAECGFVTVPLDHDKPRGEQIKIAVSRVRHSVPDSQYQGALLVNPGGPGGSGLIYSIFGALLPDSAAAYDWIGFDPRGVGSSVPALSCDNSYFNSPRPTYQPTKASDEAAWLARSKAYAKACGTAGGKLLDHLKTTDSVEDMDLIRRALGESKINYLGFSYGTYLGQVYATEHPERVRRMILDGNVDPTKVWYEANLDQDKAFEINANRWFAWLAQYDNVYHLGSTQQAVKSLWYAQRTALASAPVGNLGPAEWDDVFLSVGYSEGAWPFYGSMFAGWIANHDPAPLLADYASANVDGGDNGYAIYNAVQCSDAKWPSQYSKWKRDNTAVNAVAPFVTWGNVWFNAPCLFWPAKSGEPVQVNGRKAPAILLLSETLDGATPYSGSLEVRSRFPKAALVATPGGGTHANSLGNDCALGYVLGFLADGSLPARKRGTTSDAECATNPLPLPDELAARAARPAGASTARLGLRPSVASLVRSLGR